MDTLVFCIIAQLNLAFGIAGQVDAGFQDADVSLASVLPFDTRQRGHRRWCLPAGGWQSRCHWRLRAVQRSSSVILITALSDRLCLPYPRPHRKLTP